MPTSFSPTGLKRIRSLSSLGSTSDNLSLFHQITVQRLWISSKSLIYHIVVARLSENIACITPALSLVVRRSALPRSYSELFNTKVIFIVISPYSSGQYYTLIQDSITLLFRKYYTPILILTHIG